MMIETTRVDTNISPLSQSYDNTELDVHEREEKFYAKIFDPSEFEGKTKDDLVFFDCDYILRCISGPFYGRQIRLKDLGESITIGYSENKCKFSVKDNLISEIHCKLNYLEDSFYYSLEDCDSQTGTWIQILSMEDGYEVTENADFKLFDHEFSIIFDEVRKNKKSECIIRFTAGEKKGKSVEMIKGETIRIGKKDEKITLSMKVQESVLIKIVSLNDKIYILDETQEPYDGGLFLKLKNKILIRSGDCFKIGNSSFKLIPYNFAFFSELGDRSNQEDKFVVCEDLRVFEDIILPYFAIYDGHGGPSCSEFIKKNLHNEIHYYLKELVNEKSQNFLSDLVNALQKIIILVDINYFDSELNFSAHHGSTCVFVFFIGTYVLCCNLGDSVAILLRKNDKRVYLSRDFNPKREIERQRIELKNGYITNDGRLLGNISVSRAFGDWKFKDKLKQSLLKNNKEFGEYLITNRAEFRLIELNPSVDNYIMLASDGIFLHGTHDSLCHSLDNHLKNGVIENGIVNIPKALDNFRLDLIKLINSDDKNKGESDNMTMIVIKLFNDQNLN
jgi:serine/threonine protein phosphatase PrpC